MRQPNTNDSTKYLKEYIVVQSKKLRIEMAVIDRRTKKLTRAINMYDARHKEETL